MEFLPTNLTSCLERYSMLPEEINYSILNDVSLGLSYLHGQIPVIVHRDLSANNVLLSTSMTAKISDLGVARILNLTPLQVSRMTETPGTPAYMPPEVMVADPHYDTSVDVFSFGVMIIHTLTAEWPLPKVGPIRIDPAHPDVLIPVTEAERREYFIRKIAQDHPLTDLIMSCLNNNPQRRPRAEEIVSRMGDLVLQYPPSFENRVEMLQRISALLTEKRELEQEIVKNVSTIGEKADEVERLSEEKRQQKEENEKAIKRIELAHSVQTDQLQLQNEDIRNQLEVTHTLVNSKDAQITQLGTNCTELEQQISLLETENATLTSQVSTLISTIEQERADATKRVEQERISTRTKEAVITSKESDIAARDRSLENKEATIQRLNSQLTKTRDYLTSEPQPLQVQLSYSQCSEAPVKMNSGLAILINDKVYYGGGVGDDEHYIHCFTPSQDVWSTLPRLPLRYFGLGEVKGELVTVGGDKEESTDQSSDSDASSEPEDNHSTTNEIHMFDERSQKWKHPIPPMPTARNQPAVISCPTHLVVAGGWLPPYEDSAVVEIYNINTSQWSKTDSLPYRCDDPRGTVCNNTVYLMGGVDGQNFSNKVVTAQIDKLFSNSVPVDQPNDDRNPNNASDCDSAWKEIAHTPAYTPSTVAMSDMVLAVGGRDSADIYEYTPTQGIYAYSSSMDSWIYIGDLLYLIVHAATVALSPTEFLVIGGTNEHIDRLSTVHKATLHIAISK